MLEVIEKVMDEILKEKIDFYNIKKVLEEFKSLLLEITELDLKSLSNKSDLQLEEGMALCTTFAALCIDDIIRTRQFIRGIYKAVLQVKKQTNESVTILYAGTGPFATLALPLLTKFGPDEVQLVLMEVNKNTIHYLNHTIEKLDIGKYVNKVICGNASTYQLENSGEIDILISETMQHALVKEQQVPIMLNLVNQLKKDVIIIPENIKLDLALWDTSSKEVLNDEYLLKYELLETLLNFNKQFIHSFVNGQDDNRINLCHGVKFRTDNSTQFDKLAILTSIHTYADEWIRYGESGLCIPKILLDTENTSSELKEISLQYVFDGNPHFTYTLN